MTQQAVVHSLATPSASIEQHLPNPCTSMAYLLTLWTLHLTETLWWEFRSILCDQDSIIVSVSIVKMINCSSKYTLLLPRRSSCHGLPCSWCICLSSLRMWSFWTCRSVWTCLMRIALDRHSCPRRRTLTPLSCSEGRPEGAWRIPSCVCVMPSNNTTDFICPTVVSMIIR
jgi:hypothetical protein